MRLVTFFATLLLLLTALSVFSAVPNGGWDGCWSPDGKLIAFVSGVPHGVSNIWVMNADGSDARQLTYKGGRSPRWVPGTQTIVFSTLRTGTERVLAIDASAEPGTEKRHPALPENAIAPVWTADGRSVAYLILSASGRSRDLWVAEADGKGAKGISMNFFVRDYAWAPDGKNIAFVVGRTIGSSLWITDIETKDGDVDIVYKGFCSTPVYSADGKYLAFSSPSPKGDHKIVYIDLETGIDKRVMVQSFDGNSIHWRPDGKGFLYTSNRKGDAGIWTVGKDGRNITRLTDKATAAYGPAYSPDNTRLVFFATTAKSSRPNVYTADAGGANIKALTKTQHSEWAPAWSHNGAKLAAVSDASSTGKLLVVNPESGKMNNPGYVALGASVKPVWSPNDGKILVIQGPVMSVTASTASKPSEKRIARVDGRIDACWSADAKSVYFTNWKGDRAGISLIATDGQEPKQLTTGSDKTRPAETIAVPNADIHKAMGIAGPLEETRSAVVNISDLYPRLSPDGELVAFVRDNQVWTVEASGRAQRQLTNMAVVGEETKSDVSSLEWSPNGKLLMFQRHIYNEQSGLESQIWLVESDTGETKKIYSEKIETEYGVYAAEITYPPVFTPDGKSVLFTSTANGGSQICTIDLTGKEKKILVEELSTYPAMAPNGTKLAYISLEDCRERLMILDLAAGKKKELRLAR